MASTEGAGFEPLDLIGEHLDAIEGLWAMRRQVLFSKAAGEAELAVIDRRVAAHVAGLRARPAEAARRARARLHARRPIALFTGAFALLHLDPGSLRDDLGRLRIARAAAFPVADAIAHAPPTAGWRIADDARLLDGATVAAPPPEEALRAALASAAPEIRRGAMLAAARGQPAPRLLDRLRAEAASAGEHRAVALYALGLLDEGAPAIVLATGEALIDALDTSPAAALFGAPALAARAIERARDEPASARRIHALGLLGAPLALPYLADRMADEDPIIADAATRAFHTITGHMLVARAEGVLRGDAVAARRLAGSASSASGARLHLGAPLHAATSEVSAPGSARWLRALLGAPRASHRLAGLRSERPDWLFGEGYGALVSGPADLGPALAPGIGR